MKLDLRYNDIRQKLDLRAEVLMGEVLPTEGDNMEFALRPLGPYKRGVNRDIIAITKEENLYGKTQHIINVSRPGLYDYLPIGLFHKMSTRRKNLKTKRQKEEIIELVKTRKKEEVEARRFFRPFDQEFNRFRFLAEKEERKLELEIKEQVQAEIFEAIWGNYDDLITPAQKKMLLYLAPLAHHIVGNERLTALCFQAVLRTNVSLTTRYQSNVDSIGKSPTKLNSCYLGVDSILGIISEELELDYYLQIGPIPKNKAQFFLPNRPGEKIIEILCGFFIPVEVNVSFNLLIQADRIVFPSYNTELGPNTSDNILGYTSRL